MLKVRWGNTWRGGLRERCGWSAGDSRGPCAKSRSMATTACAAVAVIQFRRLGHPA